MGLPGSQFSKRNYTHLLLASQGDGTSLFGHVLLLSLELQLFSDSMRGWIAWPFDTGWAEPCSFSFSSNWPGKAKPPLTGNLETDTKVCIESKKS